MRCIMDFQHPLRINSNGCKIVQQDLFGKTRYHLILLLMEFTVACIGCGSGFGSFIKFYSLFISVCIKWHLLILLQWLVTLSPNEQWNSKKLACLVVMEIGLFHMLVRNYGTYCQLLSVTSTIWSNSSVNWNPFWWQEETSSSADRKCVSGDWFLFRGCVIGMWIVLYGFRLFNFTKVFNGFNWSFYACG